MTNEPKPAAPALPGDEAREHDWSGFGRHQQPTAPPGAGDEARARLREEAERLLKDITPGEWRVGYWSGQCHIPAHVQARSYPGPPECIYDPEFICDALTGYADRFYEAAYQQKYYGLAAKIRRVSGASTPTPPPAVATGEPPAERPDDADMCGRCSHQALWHANLGTGDCQVRTGCDCHEFKRSVAQSPTPALADRLRELVQSIRTIQLVAGQCSVEGFGSHHACEMAAAEAERCRKWADELEALLATVSPRVPGGEP